MSSIWTGLYKRSSFESSALWEESFLQDCTRWLEAPLQSCPSALVCSLHRERPKNGEAGWLGGGWAVCFPFFLGKYCTRATLSPFNTTGLRAYSRGGKAGGMNSKRDQSPVENTVLTDCFKDGGKAQSLFHDCVWSYVPLAPATGGGQFHERTPYPTSPTPFFVVRALLASHGSGSVEMPCSSGHAYRARAPSVFSCYRTFQESVTITAPPPRLLKDPRLGGSCNFGEQSCCLFV